MGTKVVPRSIRTAVAATTRVLRLGNLVREYEHQELRRKEEHDAIETAYASRLTKLKGAIEKLTREIIDYAERHRTALSGGKDVSKVRLDTGSLEWSPGKPFVEVFDADTALASILRLEKKGHPDIVRRTVEINKQYLHDHPELLKKIRGVRWSRRPAHILRFEDTQPRIEHSPDDDSVSITFPKQKK